MFVMFDDFRSAASQRKICGIQGERPGMLATAGGSNQRASV
jgi:hypothetical protein